MNVLAVRSPYLPQAKHSGIPKAAYGEQFSDILEKEQALSRTDEIAASETSKDPYGSSYTVTEEQAEYFREKYGEEYNEEQPYQLFYELAEKHIISYDEAANASGYSRIFSEYMRQNGTWKEHFTNHNTYGCFNSYYERFMRMYDKEINTWQDVAQREYDFSQYLIDLDERLITPDGTYFQSSKEQMNVGFRKECESILKVKDVLTQIFGEVSL